MPARRRFGIVGSSEATNCLGFATANNGLPLQHEEYKGDPCGGLLGERTDAEADIIDLTTDGLRSSVTVTMTARDRTSEFTNAIRSMQSRNAARASFANQQNPRHVRHIQSYSHFMMIAKNIGKNIASTYAKLEKLALCKSPMYRSAARCGNSTLV